MRAQESRDDGRAYVLGHTQREIERLNSQARMVEPITRGIFLNAGLAPGMKVLDIGSGSGAVSLLAAEIVGPGGSVTGADLSAAAVAAATGVAAERGITNVTFLQGDASDMTFDTAFDAVVGRYVLMFIPDPAAALRKLRTHLRPGGIMAFHEADWGGVRAYPAAPVYEQCSRWIARTMELQGVDLYMGTRLYRAFLGAGLPPPAMSLAAIVGGGRSRLDWALMMADLFETLLPDALRLGVATQSEVGLPDLRDRITAEVAERETVIVGRSEVGAWVRNDP